MPLDVGLCERCNPLGLRDVSSSQAHGTVFLGIGVAVVALMLGALFAVRGIGPFQAQVVAFQPDGDGFRVSLAVKNEGIEPGLDDVPDQRPDERRGAGGDRPVAADPAGRDADVRRDGDGPRGLAEAAHRGVLVAVTVDAASASPASVSAAADLAFAVELARTAGRVLMDRYERVERIDYKSARDVVTEVDHLSEALIIAAIRERYPGDGILAEESGAHAGGEGDAPTSGSGRVWIIDPVDGTINYANGIPFFCVSIGLAVDGRPTGGRRPRPDPRRALRGRGRRAGDAQRRADRGLRQGQAVGLRRPMALSGRSVVSRARAVRKADPDLALDGLGGAGAGVRRATAGSTRSSSRAGCRTGTSPRPA